MSRQVDTMQIFYDRFRTGVRWINDELAKGDDPALRREIDRFFAQVVGPMDRHWDAMSTVSKNWFLLKNDLPGTGNG